MSRHMPRGSGAVRCDDCGATACADGHGTPIVLRHLPSCPELARQGLTFEEKTRLLILDFRRTELDNLTNEERAEYAALVKKLRNEEES